jgi:hypothetical protein
VVAVGVGVGMGSPSDVAQAGVTMPIKVIPMAPARPARRPALILLIRIDSVPLDVG